MTDPLWDRKNRGKVTSGASGSNKVPTRSALLNVGKGVGILLVVFAHNPLALYELSEFDAAIRSFRMPFFFFLSGSLFPAHRVLSRIALHRADAWLKPYAVVLVSLGLAQWSMDRASVESTILGLLYGTGFTLPWVPMWFLPHLWLLSVFAAFCLARTRNILTTDVHRYVFLAAMSIAGYGILQVFSPPFADLACQEVRQFSIGMLHCGLPFSADILLLTGPYFFLGHYLSSRVRGFRANAWLFVFASVVAVTLWRLYPSSLDFNHRNYSHPIVTTLIALLGIYLLLSLCAWLAERQRAAKVLDYIGRGSLFVLIFHFYLQFKIFDLMIHTGANRWFAGVSAILGSVIMCLGFWELSRKNRLIAGLLLPRYASQNSSIW